MQQCPLRSPDCLHDSACRTNGAPVWGQARRLGLLFMPQNFLSPQRDQPMLLPLDMREWLPEDDLVFIVLDAVAMRPDSSRRATPRPPAGVRR